MEFIMEFIKKIFTQDVDFAGEDYMIPGIDDSGFFEKQQETIPENKFSNKEEITIKEKQKKPDINMNKWHQL